MFRLGVLQNNTEFWSNIRIDPTVVGQANVEFESDAREKLKYKIRSDIRVDKNIYYIIVDPV
jgi:hypothetical protein